MVNHYHNYLDNIFSVMFCGYAEMINHYHNYLDNIFPIMFCGTIYCLNYGMVRAKVEHLFTLCSGKGKTPNLSIRRSNGLREAKLRYLYPTLISTTAHMKTSDRPRQETSVPRMKDSPVHYDTKTDKAVIRSVNNNV